MRRRSVFFLPLLAVCGGLAAAQPPAIPDWENAAKFELVASQSPVRPGDRLEIAVLAELEHGYHLYGPEEAPPTATAVELLGGGAFEGGEPRYPEPIRRDLSGLGEYDLYEGTVAIRIPVAATMEAAGGRSAAAEVLVRYQLCTDNACSAPTSAALELVLPMAAEGSAVEMLHPDVFGEAR